MQWKKPYLSRNANTLWRKQKLDIEVSVKLTILEVVNSIIINPV